MGLMSLLGFDQNKRSGTPFHRNTLRAFKAHRGFLTNMVLPLMENGSDINNYMIALSDVINGINRGYSLEYMAPKTAPMINGVLEFLPHDSDMNYFKGINNNPYGLLKENDIIVYERVAIIVNKCGVNI